jgi:hypothetical protein
MNSKNHKNVMKINESNSLDLEFECQNLKYKLNSELVAPKTFEALEPLLNHVKLLFCWSTLDDGWYFSFLFFLFYSLLTKINNTSLNGLFMYEKVSQCICKNHN